MNSTKQHERLGGMPAALLSALGDVVYVADVQAHELLWISSAYDKSLIADVTENPRLHLMLESIVQYIQHLGVQTVAEGVETEAQLRVLRRLGVQQV